MSGEQDEPHQNERKAKPPKASDGWSAGGLWVGSGVRSPVGTPALGCPVATPRDIAHALARLAGPRTRLGTRTHGRVYRDPVLGRLDLASKHSLICSAPDPVCCGIT